ncbi:hypothetical protein AK812_SmicGene46329, partial [Symbiodinium microadriaticum]
MVEPFVSIDAVERPGQAQSSLGFSEISSMRQAVGFVVAGWTAFVTVAGPRLFAGWNTQGRTAVASRRAAPKDVPKGPE